jgi:hypothetical protein
LLSDVDNCISDKGVEIDIDKLGYPVLQELSKPGIRDIPTAIGPRVIRTYAHIFCIKNIK